MAVSAATTAANACPTVPAFQLAGDGAAGGSRGHQDGIFVYLLRRSLRPPKPRVGASRGLPFLSSCLRMVSLPLTTYPRRSFFSSFPHPGPSVPAAAFSAVLLPSSSMARCCRCQMTAHGCAASPFGSVIGNIRREVKTVQVVNRVVCDDVHRVVPVNFICCLVTFTSSSLVAFTDSDLGHLGRCHVRRWQQGCCDATFSDVAKHRQRPEQLVFPIISAAATASAASLRVSGLPPPERRARGSGHAWQDCDTRS